MIVDRKECPMRTELGNCMPVGGFCFNAVSDKICEAVHSAYNRGFVDCLIKHQMIEKEKVLKNDLRGNSMDVKIDHVVWLMMPKSCNECKFAGEMICLLTGECFPEHEMLNADFKGRYSNCPITKDKPMKIELEFK